MKVAVLTTSYPRDVADVAGHFVQDAVEHARAAGVDVVVVAPSAFRHYGIAYGHGIAGNLRRRPWLVLALPLFLLSFTRAARRASRDADLVHAHWLPSGLVARLTGKPFVVQLWGTDVELARRVPWLARPILRRARAVLCGSSALAEAGTQLGASNVVLIPTGVDVPAALGDPDEPPHVLYAGRLSPEKGIEEFVRADGRAAARDRRRGADRRARVARVRAPRGDRRVLRARGRRLRPVAPRGSRLHRPARDGPRPAGRGDPRRRPPGSRRGRRDGAPRRTGASCGLRSSACSGTASSDAASARPRASALSSSTRGRRRRRRSSRCTQRRT